MELDYPERRLNVRKSSPLSGLSGASVMVREKRWERFIRLQVRTNNRIRSPRLTASRQLLNDGKGSRQNRSVTSGKGLALRIGPRGPYLDVARTRRD